MTHVPATRILAIDVKSFLLGVAVFELPVRLLDCGKRATSADTCSAFIAQLLRKYAISAVVVRKLKRGEHRDTGRVRKGLHAVRMTARRYSIPVMVLSERRLRIFFRRYKRRTRYETAQLLATAFPELKWALPPARNFYDPEDRRMALFDAAALGATFLGTAKENERLQSLLASAVGVFSPASR